MNAIRHFLEALRSGWKAGLKQYRRRRTELRRGPIVKPSVVVPIAGPQDLAS